VGKRVERWRDSGLTAKQFAAETGVKPSTLTYWKWKLRAPGSEAESAASGAATSMTSDGSTAVSAAPKFVELDSDPSTAAVPLEIVVSRRLTLRVPTGFDEGTLVRVLRVCGALR